MSVLTGAVQGTSHPDRLYFLHDFSTARKSCIFDKQREAYIVCVVTVTGTVCNVNGTYIVWIVTDTGIVCIVME